MKLHELETLLESIIVEEINKQQLASTAQTLGVDEATIRDWVNSADPTPTKSFSVWLLRGLKKGEIQVEDDDRVRETLNRFIQLRNARRIEDIMQFPTLTALEVKIEQLAGVGSKRQGFAGIDPSTLPGVQIFEQRPDITFYKVSNADSLGKIGEGTKWCTRFSFRGNNETASFYIRKYSYLVIGYKGGKPYVQFNPDYTQVMDVNDNIFHYINPLEAKKLNLPAPEFVKNLPELPKSNMKPFRTVKDRESGLGKTDSQRGLQNWLNYTTQNNPKWNDYIEHEPGQRPNTRGKDDDYEYRVARSIEVGNSYHHLEKVMNSLAEYLRQIPGQRCPMIEKALLDKDYKYVHRARQGSKTAGTRKKIPGMGTIALYVTNNIGGHWIEFEQKLENTKDAANSIRYYLGTGLSPRNIPHGVIKDLILFSQFIKDKKPSVSSQEFEASIRDFITRARSQLKSGHFSPVLNNVLIPYLSITGKKLDKIVTPEMKRLLLKNKTFAKQVIGQVDSNEIGRAHV